MHKLKTLFIIISLFLFSDSQTSFAQASFLSELIKAKEAVVHIRAIKGEFDDSAKNIINSKTRQVLTLRSIKPGFLEKYGAGVILNKNGIIVTNIHTIRDSNIIYVKLFDGSVHPAQVVKLTASDDLALLSIKPPFKLTAVQFADSNKANLNQRVFHIGTSTLLDETISEGKIIGIGKKDGKNPVEVIQVNLNLYKGDSGGPLFDENGYLIGMMTAKLINQKKASFAIPSNKIKKLYLKYHK